MSYFDELVARYKNMQYGGLSARNPSAIDNVLRTQQGLLGNSLQFGNNNQTFMENIPTDEQQFIDTPTGRVAQNRFRMGPDGNPIFGVPGQLDADGSAGSGAASYDSSIDYGDPGYAGVLPVDPVTGLVSTQTTQRQGGRGGDRDGPGVSTQFVGNKAYRFNEDGSFEEIDPESLDYKFNKFTKNILSVTPGGIVSGLLGDDITRTYNAVKNQYDEETANKFALETDLINLARDEGVLSADLRKQGALNENQGRKDIGKETKAANAAKISAGYSGVSRDVAERQAMDARSKAAGLNAARERQKAKDKAQRDKQKRGNPNRGEKNAGGGGFNAGGR